jgi:hypothetical protein
MTSEAGVAPRVDRDENAPITLLPERSLKGFRRELVRVDTKEFIQKAEDLEEDHNSTTP